MFSSQIYCVTFVNHRCTGGFTYFTLHFIHATFCIEPRRCGAVVNKDYKLIRKGRKPGLNLPQDFLVDYQTDPYEKKNASNGNEQIVRSLYQVALKYDTITPCLPEIPYGKGREGFKAPVEWKVTR